MSPNHVVITPAKNESEFIDHILESMIRQTVRPTQWIIVDDHSTDGMAAKIDQKAKEHAWLKRVVAEESDDRRVGAHVARLVLFGLRQVDASYDFISKVDADLTLPPNYFEEILGGMARDDELGIAGGICCDWRGEELVAERVPLAHTRGALKTYRRECYEEIGGIRPTHGWDGIDGTLAQMHGWKTRHFADLQAVHHRPTGAFHGVLKGRFTAGQFAHFMGYHPLFMAGRVIRRMPDRPLVVGALSLGAGYCWNALIRKPVFDEPEVVAFLRETQLARLGLRFLGSKQRKSST